MDEEPRKSKDVLNDLRNFRINKTGRKRLQILADSDSDNAETGSPLKRLKVDISTNKEYYLHLKHKSVENVTREFKTSLEKSDVQSKLMLKEGIPAAKKHKSSKSIHSDDDSPDGDSYNARPVYDSDESDSEMHNELNGQRSTVLSFMNNSTLIELQSVKSLSERKALMVLDLRPFVNWSDLINKLESSKSLSADLLNYAQEHLNRQQNVQNILEKCSKLVKQLEKAINDSSDVVEQPEILDKTLRLADYQKIGLNWLVVMHSQSMNGILADEMGLGKTIQVIAFLAYLKQNNKAKYPHLIVVPSSTLDNWESELNKWCPSMNVQKYHGNQEQRKKMRQCFAKEGFGDIDVLLTTYHVVASTPEERKMFRVCKFQYTVFDEAHMLKNMTTQRYSQLIMINTEMRLLLTGTPLQNNLLELMSLLCFVMPNFFKKSIEDIKSLFSKKSTALDKDSDDGSSKFQETQIERAKRIMKPFVLRRLKKDVLNNLPQKISFVHNVPMSEKQKVYYNNLVQYYSNNKGEICSEDRVGISIMMEMRKCANHPLLLRYYFDELKLKDISRRLAKTASYKKTNEEYIFEDLLTMSDFQIWQLCDNHNLTDVQIPDELICDSGKFLFFDTLLPKLKKGGHRVLVFSQFTMMLDVIEKYLVIRNHGYCRLDGTTAVEERQDLINDFNNRSDIFIFLLSTKAGGVGINLTAADTCIIHDIDFNPYNDKQAEDRCHRLGQTKNVTIHRLLSEGTLEEGMQMIATEKLKLEENITGSEKEKQDEQKCVMKLLSMVLGLSN